MNYFSTMKSSLVLRHLSINGPSGLESLLAVSQRAEGSGLETIHHLLRSGFISMRIDALTAEPVYSIEPGAVIARLASNAAYVSGSQGMRVPKNGNLAVSQPA